MLTQEKTQSERYKQWIFGILLLEEAEMIVNVSKAKSPIEASASAFTKWLNKFGASACVVGGSCCGNIYGVVFRSSLNSFT